jgi:hypothetical protein
MMIDASFVLCPRPQPAEVSVAMRVLFTFLLLTSDYWLLLSPYCLLLSAFCYTLPI